MVVQAYREKLEAKVHGKLSEDSQIDDSRIAAEVVLFSDKICNDEETVRLHSHIRGMKDPYRKRRDRTETGFYGSGNEPGGKHNPLQV